MRNIIREGVVNPKGPSLKQLAMSNIPTLVLSPDAVLMLTTPFYLSPCVMLNCRGTIYRCINTETAMISVYQATSMMVGNTIPMNEMLKSRKISVATDKMKRNQSVMSYSHPWVFKGVEYNNVLSAGWRVESNVCNVFSKKMTKTLSMFPGWSKLMGKTQTSLVLAAILLWCGFTPVEKSENAAGYIENAVNLVYSNEFWVNGHGGTLKSNQIVINVLPLGKGYNNLSPSYSEGKLVSEGIVRETMMVTKDAWNSVIDGAKAIPNFDMATVDMTTMINEIMKMINNTVANVMNTTTLASTGGAIWDTHAAEPLQMGQ